MRLLFVVCLLLVTKTPGFGFALLGPYAPWMEERLGYRLPEDIGGPMQLHEEYRWNLPVITYGFDQEFLNYFGYEGVQAVSRAITTLNNLPPASQIVAQGSNLLINKKPVSSSTIRVNDMARTLALVDLKSHALAALLQELGLASPERNVWTLRARIVSESQTNYSIFLKNFDPIRMLPSMSVNGVSYTYTVVESGNPTVADAVETPVDPLATFAFCSVAGARLRSGDFFAGLTLDDVAGLRYLLRRSNQNVECLPAGVTGINGRPFVNKAIRPGVEKIQFIAMRNRPLGGFYPITNKFTDVFIKDGVWMQQRLQRIVTRPDILFRARELPPIGSSVCPPLVTHGSTSRWTNNARLNGVFDGAGPGVIPPGAVITFAKFAMYSGPNGDTAMPCFRWGSYNGSTNPPVVYPVKPR